MGSFDLIFQSFRYTHTYNEEERVKKNTEAVWQIWFEYNIYLFARFLLQTVMLQTQRTNVCQFAYAWITRAHIGQLNEENCVWFSIHLGRWTTDDGRRTQHHAKIILNIVLFCFVEKYSTYNNIQSKLLLLCF